MPRRQVQAFALGPRTDQRQLIRRGRAKTRPRAGGHDATQLRNKFNSARQHSPQYAEFNLPSFFSELARRADQQLPSRSRLHVERNGIRDQRVRTFQVAKLHQLMAHKIWIAVCNHQMALAWPNRQPASEAYGPTPGGVHNYTARNLRGILQLHAVAQDFHHTLTQLEPRIKLLGPLKKIACGAWRIDHRIARYQ